LVLAVAVFLWFELRVKIESVAQMVKFFLISPSCRVGGY
jgi:hypothetical protein